MTQVKYFGYVLVTFGQFSVTIKISKNKPYKEQWIAYVLNTITFDMIAPNVNRIVAHNR